MKKKIAFGTAVIAYLSAVVLLGYYFLIEFSENLILSPIGRLVALFIVCALMYAGGASLSMSADGKRKNLPMKINLIIWLALYIITLVTLTMFDGYFRRSSFNLSLWNAEVFDAYIKNSLNIIPFATIASYVKSFVNGDVAPYIFMYNIFGNAVALTPFAFFLPLLFKKQEKFKIFFLTILSVVIGIELLQFATLSGSCDIDDVILNAAGACAAFGILQIKPVKALVRRAFLSEKN